MKHRVKMCYDEHPLFTVVWR